MRLKRHVCIIGLPCLPCLLDAAEANCQLFLMLGFLQVATAESQIAHYNQKRPSTAQSSSSSSPSLPELIPPLLSTIENEDGSPEELFQAQVCLGWLHWSLSEPGLAAAHLPKDFGEVADKLGENISPWTEVCLVKGCYMKGGPVIIPCVLILLV
jgi:hypothetical protein